MNTSDADEGFSAQTLKYGIIGAGFIAKFQAWAMESVRGLKVAAVLDRGGAKDLCRQIERAGLGRPEIISSIAEMARSCDVIAIYSPNDVRLSVMEEIARAKAKGARVTGIIVDKPLGRNVFEAQRMCELAQEFRLRTAYFENQIFMKAVRAQKEQLQHVEKAQGPLMLVRSAEEHAGPHMGWFWDPRRQGGGVLNDMGCHSIAVAWYILTPLGQGLTSLKPRYVQCQTRLLKWGQKKYADKLLQRYHVDYRKTPAEDYATGTIEFEHPGTKQMVMAQFSDSWMYDKQGLRLYMDGLGPGYAFEINTQLSPVSIFIGDEASAALDNQERALEKSTSSRGLLSLQPNEADLYGYVDENLDAARAFREGRDGMLNFSYGLEITRLVMASYLAAECGEKIDLYDAGVQDHLQSYVPLIQKGEGLKVLA